MKLPRTVQIGAYTWKVKIIKKFPVLKKEPGREQTGMCDSASLTLYIKKGLREVDVRITFIHECMHAIEYSYDMYVGEKKIRKLDNYLICLIQDNNLDFR